MLEVSGLSKAFEKVQAVKNFSFKVKNGEVLGLIGPNGAGKTTALRCICTILTPDAGVVRVNGVDIFSNPVEAKKHLAYIPEIPHPFGYLTVEEHVEFAARAFELRDWKDRADELIERFDLGEKKKELVHTLSKGQRQKVNIISAFIHQPNVVLMDEPLYGIDPKGGKYLKTLVKAARARGASIVISSHTLSLVEELANKVLIMAEGEKLVEGSVDKVAQMARLKKDTRLEDVFIEITEKARGVK
ncbi:ABC transporter ATP-binding protein [[Eubacterium] cellulosolvens]